ncbi:MAG: hypothetical protein LLG06_01805 [Desulfobacteraceae bacterium]|nr:hypothetical protein [Desulfobacteraceae bacterium]
MALHIQTSQHVNISGAYLIDKARIAKECGIAEAQVTEALKKLQEMKFAYYDEETEQIYVPSVPYNTTNRIFKHNDNRIKMMRRCYENLNPSYVADAFYDDVGVKYGIPKRSDYGQSKWPVGITDPQSIETSEPLHSPVIASEPITADPLPPPPPPPPPRPQKTMNDLLSRYTEDQQIRILQVWDCIRDTRKSGKISEKIISAELRRWDKLDPDRVLYGIDKYLEKGYHENGKREEYLYAIMLRASPAEIERYEGRIGPASGKNGVPQVSSVTAQNMKTLQSLWGEQDNDIPME